jgi:hypothetical protein
MDLAQTELGKLREQLPEATLYISAQPDYSRGPRRSDRRSWRADADRRSGRDPYRDGRGPGRSEQSPPEQSQTNDGCHANDAGKEILGSQLNDFLTSLKS